MDVSYEETILYLCSEENCPGSLSISKSLPSPEGFKCVACHKGHYIKYEEPKYVGWHIEG